MNTPMLLILYKVYPGADATFPIYEDAGDGYDCERKGYVTYTLHWDDSHRQLSISARTNSTRRRDGPFATSNLRLTATGNATFVG